MSTMNKRVWLMSTGVASMAIMLLLSGYTGAAVTGGGTVSGAITLQGNPPALAATPTGGASAICGASVPNEEIVRSGNNLANVVVWIDGIQNGKPVVPGRVTLDNSGCRYVPHVQSATVGSTLVVTSQDATLHNIHAFSGAATAFNLALPSKGMRVQRRLTATGPIRFQCDAGHTWMSGHLHVFDHPYHVVTTNNGRFSLADVPPGTYTVKAWHERLGTQTAQVTVTAGGTATANLAFRAH